MTPDILIEATRLNTAFSTLIPGLQLAWDSTSMGTFKECPRKYYLSILHGWQPRAMSVHLIFGLHYHSVLEAYDHAKFRGLNHQQAMSVAVKTAMVLTWDKKLGRPWMSDDKYKNRLTLLRSIVWYLDQFENDPMQTVRLANGKPAVELSFRFNSTYQNSAGETYLLCGHLDRLAEMNSQFWILDRKTTKNQIDERYWRQFSPNNQMSQYDFAGKVVYNLPIQGIIIDAAQVLITGTRFKRGFATRDDDQRNEWYHDMGLQLDLAERYAKACYWPMNDKSCGNFGGCPFQDICGKSPKVRDQWLKGAYTKRLWDPLQVRGDI